MKSPAKSTPPMTISAACISSHVSPWPIQMLVIYSDQQRVVNSQYHDDLLDSRISGTNDCPREFCQLEISHASTLRGGEEIALTHSQTTGGVPI